MLHFDMNFFQRNHTNACGGDCCADSSPFSVTLLLGKSLLFVTFPMPNYLDVCQKRNKRENKDNFQKMK